MSDIIDIKLVKDSDGVYDLVFENGGFATDETMLTPIIIDITTDQYVSSFPVNSRQGHPVVTFGSILWSVIRHACFDEVIVDKVLEIINDIANVYVEAGVWERHEIEVLSKGTFTLKIQLTTYNEVGNVLNKYFLPITSINRV